MAAAPLGKARCPLCGSTARVSLSKSGYAVMTCNGCNLQLFTRSPRSDELVRDLIRPEAEAPAAAPAPTPAPAAQAKPAALPKPAPAAAPAPAASGLMSSWFR